jgi:hypothetical protein
MNDLKTPNDLLGTIAGSSVRDVVTGAGSFVHFLNNGLRGFGTIDCHGATTLLAIGRRPPLSPRDHEHRHKFRISYQDAELAVPARRRPRPSSSVDCATNPGSKSRSIARPAS